MTARTVQPSRCWWSRRNGGPGPSRAKLIVARVPDGTRVQAGLVGDLADQRQAVAGLGTPLGGVPGTGRLRDPVVADLAEQGPVRLPDPEPPVPGAVAHGVGGQFVHGDDQVVGPARRQPGLRGVRRHRRAQRVQRIFVEGLLQDRAPWPQRSARARSAARRSTGARLERAGAGSAGGRARAAGGGRHWSSTLTRLTPGISAAPSRTNRAARPGRQRRIIAPGQGQAPRGVQDHPGARDVDEGQRGHVDGHVAVEPDRLGQREREGVGWPDNRAPRPAGSRAARTGGRSAASRRRGTSRPRPSGCGRRPTEASVTGSNRSRSYWHSTETAVPATAAATFSSNSGSCSTPVTGRSAQLMSTASRRPGPASRRCPSRGSARSWPGPR